MLLIDDIFDVFECSQVNIEFRISSNDENVKITINNDINLSIREKLQAKCTIEEGVTLEQLSGNVPGYYICIGKSNLEECQNEITDYDPDSGVEWIWMPVYPHYTELKKYIKKIYITDKILTPNADITLFSSEIVIDSNQINNFHLQDGSNINFVIYPAIYDETITIEYKSAPKCNFELFIINDINLKMNIPNDYVPNSIKLGGYTRILVSKGLISIIDIFDSPNTIIFEYNNGPPDCICICNENTCEKCKEGIIGYVEFANSITSDPGENVEIRIFDDVELTSSIFTNEHSVYVNSDYQLTLVDAQLFIQKSTDEIKIDNLIIGSVNNLLIKENNELSSLDFGCTDSVFMSTISIEISGRLRIYAYGEKQVPLDKMQFSNLNITGKGEINIYRGNFVFFFFLEYVFLTFIKLKPKM